MKRISDITVFSNVFANSDFDEFIEIEESFAQMEAVKKEAAKTPSQRKHEMLLAIHSAMRNC